MRRLLGLWLLVGLGCASGAWADITTNLILLLRLNEGTGGAGTVLTDSSPVAHPDCSLDSTNPPAWLSGASCKQGACLSWDGVNDRMRCAYAADFSPTNGTTDVPYSLTLWVYLNDITTGEGNIVGRNQAGNLEYQLWISASTLYMQFYDTTTATIGRSAPLTTGAHQAQWIHLAATYSGSATHAGIKIYINGAQADTADAGSGTYAKVTDGGIQTEFGIYNGTAGPLSARMDELKIFRRELSASDVIEDMNNILAVVGKRRVVIY